MNSPLPDWIVWSRFVLRPVVAPVPVAAEVAQYGDWVLDTIAPEVDQHFYRSVAGLGAGDDPVRHFAEVGWQAGLNPNTWFDTRFYLAFYPDIAEAGMNPFFHFIYYGRAEGRMPARPGGSPRHVVEQARIPSRRPPGWDAPADAPRLDLAGLRAAVAGACLGATGLVLSVSHDCYVNVTGGMQILIADEQALFNGDRTAYFHVAPAIARFTFAPADEEVLLQVSVDGVFLGLAPEGMVEAVLGAGFVPAHRVLIVHSILGHRATGLERLAWVLGPVHAVFWLHDYAALCEGFNLLRNDVAYCGAPPVASTACRICVYGAERTAYLTAMGRLFAAVGFHVLAPSRVALDLFLARTELPFRTARVHDNLVMAGGELVAAAAEGGVPRVAFAGFAIPPKGWPVFQALLQRQAGHSGYRFFHFAVASNRVAMTGLKKVDVAVRPGDRFAMVDALRAHSIDLVAVLSPWPETFSFVVHEALAAGADVVALADGGNVAAAVMRYGRGVVLREASDVVRFFEEGWALDYARQLAAAGRETGRLVLTGTSATVDLGALAPVGLGDLETGEAGLAVVLGDGRCLAGDAGGVVLPAGTVEVRLVSRHALPLLEGVRRGVAVAGLALDGVAVGLDDARLGRGWLAVEGGVRWTDGCAVLRVAGGRCLTVELAPVGRWRRVPLARA